MRDKETRRQREKETKGRGESKEQRAKSGGQRAEHGIQWPGFRRTEDMIEAIEEGRFPQKVMITVHPQRWRDSVLPWVKELVWQNGKNILKKYFLVKREKEEKIDRLRD